MKIIVSEFAIVEILPCSQDLHVYTDVAMMVMDQLIVRVTFRNQDGSDKRL